VSAIWFHFGVNIAANDANVASSASTAAEGGSPPVNESRFVGHHGLEASVGLLRREPGGLDVTSPRHANSNTSEE